MLLHALDCRQDRSVRLSLAGMELSFNRPTVQCLATVSSHGKLCCSCCWVSPFVSHFDAFRLQYDSCFQVCWILVWARHPAALPCGQIGDSVLAVQRQVIVFRFIKIIFFKSVSFDQSNYISLICHQGCSKSWPNAISDSRHCGREMSRWIWS